MTETFWQTSLRSWTGDRVAEFLGESVREGTHLEYKGARPHDNSERWRVSDDLLETIASMSNTADGLILVGVATDGASCPTALTDLPHPNPAKALHDRCDSDIQPAVQIDTEVLMVSQEDRNTTKRVMLVQVRRGPNPPYVLRDKGVYVRVDEHDRPARRADLDALYRRQVLADPAVVSPWTRISTDITLTANQTLEMSCPLVGVGLTPVFPGSPIELGAPEDERFRPLCADMLGYFAEPVRAPGSVAMMHDDPCPPFLQYSRSEAFADGTIEVKKLCMGADAGDDGVRNVGAVALWKDLRSMLSGAASWPREVCGAGGLLEYIIAVGNIANSRLVLPHRESIEWLTAADKQTPRRLNQSQYWVTQGEWDPETPVDDLISLFYSWAIGASCQEGPEHFAGMTAGEMKGDGFQPLANPAPNPDEAEAQSRELQVRDVEAS